MRSSMDYFAALRTQRVTDDATPCPLLLVHAERARSTGALAPEWETVWEYRRGAGKRLETFRLLRRAAP